MDSRTRAADTRNERGLDVTRMTALLSVAVLAMTAAWASAPAAQVPAGAAPAPPAAEAAERIDYADPAAWLCLPGREDACATDLSATVIETDGSTRIEEWAAHPNPPIDCFYVYPTVSLEPTRNSGIVPTAAEANVAARQFARFGSRCRLFAPMYRQMTLAGLRSGQTGGMDPMANEALAFAYQDVRDAWNSYLENENNGRGVVLVGHSQGSIMLIRLLAEEIESRPIHRQLVSALLLGWNVVVPEERDMGGSLEITPLCRSREQFGCVVTYVSFSEDSPPPPGALFGRTAFAGMKVGCTNPASLAGGSATLDAYLAANRTGLPPWLTPERPITTPFVKVPGMVSAACVHDANGSYLSISVRETDTARSTVLGGNVMNADGTPNAAWGLHLLDSALGMGDLVDLVGAQTRAYQVRLR